MQPQEPSLALRGKWKGTVPPPLALPTDSWQLAGNLCDSRGICGG